MRQITEHRLAAESALLASWTSCRGVRRRWDERASTGTRDTYGCESTTERGSMGQRRGVYRRAWPAAASERKAPSGQRVCHSDFGRALRTAARGYGFERPRAASTRCGSLERRLQSVRSVHRGRTWSGGTRG